MLIDGGEVVTNSASVRREAQKKYGRPEILELHEGRWFKVLLGGTRIQTSFMEHRIIASILSRYPSVWRIVVSKLTAGAGDGYIDLVRKLRDDKFKKPAPPKDSGGDLDGWMGVIKKMSGGKVEQPPAMTKLIKLAETIRDMFDCVGDAKEGVEVLPDDPNIEEHAYNQTSTTPSGDAGEGCLHCMAVLALAEIGKAQT